MKRWVTLKGCASYTIEGPFSRKRYSFTCGVRTEVHPRDWEYFKSLPSKFTVETDSGEPVLQQRRFTPLDHVTVVPRKVPIGAIKAESQNTLAARSRGKQEWLKSNAERKVSTSRARTNQVPEQPAQQVTTVLKADRTSPIIESRIANPALNARTPEEALRLFESNPELARDAGVAPVLVQG